MYKACKEILDKLENEGVRVNHGFNFPPRRPLTKRLKDVLEDNVDEKYYLSDEQVAGFVRTTEKAKAKGNGFRFEPIERERERGVAHTIATRAGSRQTDNFIKEGGVIDDLYKSRPPRLYNDYAPTLRAAKAGELKTWILK